MRLEGIPIELLQSVASSLPVRDIQHLRLTSKRLETVASEYLITRLWISPSSTDQERMLLVSQHMIFSKFVTEIYYDASQSISRNPGKSVPFSRASYVAYVRHALTHCHPPLSVTKAAANRGYTVYQKRKEDEEAASAYTGPHLTYPWGMQSLPEPLSQNLENFDFESHVDLLKYLPSDLATLVTALPCMPKVERFVISDRRFTDLHQLNNKAFLQVTSCFENNTYMFQEQGVRGREALVLNPRPWVANNEEYIRAQGKRAHRCFSVLMQAASMSGLSTLKDITVDRNSDASGLSCTVLDMPSTGLHHTLRAVSHLRKLQLRLNCVNDSQTRLQIDEGTYTIIRKGVLAKVCAVATNLESLEIQLDGFATDFDKEYSPRTKLIPLSDMIGQATMPKLTSLTLGWMELAKHDLLAFIEHHSETLRHLCFEGVTISQDSLPLEEREYLDQPGGSLKGVFSAMAPQLKLRYLKVTSSLDDDGWTCNEGWLRFESKVPEAIKDFLASGGERGGSITHWDDDYYDWEE